MLTIEDMIIEARRREQWQLARDLAAIRDLDHLARNPDGVYLAEEYVRHVAQTRVPELESILRQHGAAAAGYASEIIRGRWPEAEPTIADDPYGALIYARDVIRGRWLPGEAAILREPWIICEYVRAVVRERWRDAEQTLQRKWPEFMTFYHDALSDASGGREGIQ
ncbi:MAG: hypothetical protein KatS3mg059_1812 [Thermomicrobiales bacterium]|nr:MAG: hypothetical protein KatS3mg059_1812 [Thermomicrobiales bacterium]